MSSTEDAKVLSLVAAAPEMATSDETDAFLNAMTIPDLASMWGALQRLSRRDQTPGAWAAKMYFDHLPHRRPDRAVDLALELLRSESDQPTVMQLNDKFMMALFYAHGADVIDRIETEAAGNARLRWLLGGVYFGPEEAMKDRIEAIADTKTWRRDDRARRKPKHPFDGEAMSVPELARAWIEEYSKSDRDRDDNFSAMMDYERDLREEDPDKAIDLIVEILKIETNPVLLSLLAAGPLEDVISMETIDRIEREASADKRFHDLLGGVWYYRASDELKARLDALVAGNRW
ncbi:MAG: hypothetical protein PS018_14610 [bacterium]|nr:hypothetical protein [bacterium]